MTELSYRINEALAEAGWPVIAQGVFAADSPVTVVSWRYVDGAKVLDEPDAKKSE